MVAEKTKQIITDVASKLFVEKGFHETTMDEIAQVAKKAKGSLYYHFRSKEELFAAVIEKEMKNLKEVLSSITSDQALRAEEKIKQYLLTRMKTLNMMPCYQEALRLNMHLNNTHIKKIRHELELFEKVNLKRILLQGIEQGDFEDITRSVDIIIEVFNIVQKGLETPFFLQGNYKKYAYHFDDMINILIKGLRK
jgi:AcrR family transcriptional regulator